VLDLGCGTGNVSLLAAPRVGKEGLVVGIDLAIGALKVAARKAEEMRLGNVQFKRMDCREMAFADDSFDVVVSCLGIASSGHQRCFQESRRVLRDRGRFLYCCWTGKGSAIGNIFLETLAEFRVEDPPAALKGSREARRCLGTSEDAGQMRDRESLMRNLKKVGFERASVQTEVQRVTFPSLEAFIDFRRSFGDDERELRAMDVDSYRAFRKTLEERIQPFLTGHGVVAEWEVQYCTAHK
jgi:ubiquinone/menaquinone biosynthesis C-methylase UbiE